MSRLTKARTLEYLRPKLKLARIEPLLAFGVAEWNRAPAALLARIAKRFPKADLVVRSSSVGEDTLSSSNAGRFDSVLGVPSGDSKKLKAAIDRVKKSMAGSGPGSQVFVQPMVSKVLMSGVLFTRDQATAAPYWIVNYDDASGLTDTVTSGAKAALKTYVRFKGQVIAGAGPLPGTPRLERLIRAAEEIEAAMGLDHLDIEFAFDAQDALVIFQVRPLVLKEKVSLGADGQLAGCLRKAYKKVLKLGGRHPHLFGDRSLFGVMPDWNPAEIIGVKPRRLAISLYKELVTDRTWAYQRDNYGYMNLRSFPLLVSLLGVPYIDVRVSFNSFVPKSLDPGIAGKLINHYLDRLESHPASHDKVEFDIVFSCYALDVSRKLAALLKKGFNEHELKRIEFSLLNLTNSIIDPVSGLYRRDLEKVRKLEEKHRRVMSSGLPIIDRIYWLVEDCKRYGTLPFAGIARSAFIAVQFLRSFVSQGILTQDEYHAFMNSLSSVTRAINRDHYQVATGKLPKEEFLAKYGHLRPGTYDILSWRYDERYDLYFSGKAPKKPEEEKFRFRPEQMRKLAAMLREQGIKLPPAKFLDYIRSAIEGREYSKFVFTKNLSEILRLVGQLGEKCGLGRDDLSHLDIQTVLGMYSTLDHRDLKDILKEDIEKNRSFEAITRRVKLPTLITGPESVYAFHQDAGEPNYVTQGRVVGETLPEDVLLKGRIDHKIVFIKSADPGYDWIFAKNPTGLVTMYGGANSHMAIRCAELGIPAVIGAGEKNFLHWMRARRLEIDAMNRTTTILA